MDPKINRRILLRKNGTEVDKRRTVIHGQLGSRTVTVLRQRRVKCQRSFPLLVVSSVLELYCTNIRISLNSLPFNFLLVDSIKMGRGTEPMAAEPKIDLHHDEKENFQGVESDF